LGTLAFFCGLVINLTLNVLLLPRIGLIGAIMATAAGNALALALVLLFSKWHGLRLSRSMVLCCALPAVLILGPWPALAAVVAIGFFAARHQWLLDEEERRLLADTASHVASPISRLVGRLEAASGRVGKASN
jgi:O-antigen/teichoic acid export membrane protein